MGNNLPGTVTKLMLLLPILFAVYFYDLPRFSMIFSSGTLLAFFLVCSSLLFLGLLLKKRILRARLELSHVSFSWGLLLLAGSAILYVYGSYTTESVWFHYESLYLLAIGYVAFRIGTGILRAMAPLLAIFAFSFFPLSLFPPQAESVIVLFSSGSLLLLFLAFVRLRVKTMIIPLAVVLLGLLAFYSSPLPLGRQGYLGLLVPVPIALLIVPRIRSIVMLDKRTTVGTCREHHVLADGFCSICGSRLSLARTDENFGLWGLVAVAAVAGLLLFASVPALALIDGAPHDAYYTTRGYSATPTPPTPEGWQVNSTALYDNDTNVYSVRQVYVPLFHPETKNYTLYYSVSNGTVPVSHGPGGGEIADWNITSNEFLQFGPFQGDLTVYSRSNLVMLAYNGRTNMMFLNGVAFQQYFVGLGVVREFKDMNVSSDTSRFLGDMNALWLPTITTDVSYSVWTSFLYAMFQGAQLLGPFLLLASSMGLMGWVAYRASRSDERLDKFLTLASVESEEHWSYLKRLLERTEQVGTGRDLAPGAGDSTVEMQRIVASLRELEENHLLKRIHVERGADVVSVWKPAV